MGMMPGVAKMKNQLANAGMDDSLLKRQIAAMAQRVHDARGDDVLAVHVLVLRGDTGSDGGVLLADVSPLHPVGERLEHGVTADNLALGIYRFGRRDTANDDRAIIQLVEFLDCAKYSDALDDVEIYDSFENNWLSISSSFNFNHFFSNLFLSPFL